MGATHGRLVATDAWRTFAVEMTDESPIWSLLDDADARDVEDWLAILRTQGPLEARVASLVVVSALFLPIDVPIEDNEWRDRLLVELRKIAAAPEEPTDLRGMAEMQLQQAKVQEVLLQQRKRGIQ